MLKIPSGEATNAPLLIVPHSHKDAYLDRYAEADKGFVDRSDAGWPAPYWDIDTGFAARHHCAFWAAG